MKKLQYLFVLAATTLLASSCAESYLDQYPAGSTITEDQYKKMDDVVSGTVKGVYPLLYAYGGDHDSFGQRSIDMYGDILCGDMAMKTFNYGWFRTDELGQTYTRRATFWVFYYDIIRACNKGINALELVGLPQLTYTLDTITDEQLMNGMYYAELLTMRGWAYASLCRYFVAPDADPASLSIPIYTEADTREDTIIGSPRATVADLYLRVEQDLLEGIQYFEAYNLVERSSKIEVNVDVARILLAYSYLNKLDYTNALKYADEAIIYGTPHILPTEQVITTGFNDVTNENWIWGQDVTVENTTSLASFFGQCDIYSYSYASAGDIKGIDKNLYEAIQAWDLRKFWWSNYAQSGKRGAKNYEFAPDGKFYSAKSKTLQGDRDWLSDNVYMRWELAYLIAAEASARLNDLSSAANYLYAITDNRVIIGQEAAYSAWQATLLNQKSMLAAINHNWRVELWGEGYGLQTFRRYGETVTLGENHRRSKKEVSPSTPRVFTFEIPTAEEYYNPFLRQTSDTKNLRYKN
jgi:hypothetical protein